MEGGGGGGVRCMETAGASVGEGWGGPPAATLPPAHVVGGCGPQQLEICLDQVREGGYCYCCCYCLAHPRGSTYRHV